MDSKRREKERLDFEVCAALEVMAAGLRACD